MTIEHKKFITLRADGKSFDSIAKKLNKAKSTLIQWSKLYQDDINDMIFLSMQSLKEEYKHTQREKYQQLLKHLSKVDKAISEIDLSKATIKDLILVRNDIQNSLNDMEKNTRFKDTGLVEKDVFGNNSITTVQLNET